MVDLHYIYVCKQVDIYNGLSIEKSISDGKWLINLINVPCVNRVPSKIY